MDEELRRFLDEEAVKKVHVRYCRGVDCMDFDLIRSSKALFLLAARCPALATGQIPRTRANRLV